MRPPPTHPARTILIATVCALLTANVQLCAGHGDAKEDDEGSSGSGNLGAAASASAAITVRARPHA